LGAETVERCQLATRRDFEDRPIAVGTANLRCPVEVPVGGLYEPFGVTTVPPIEAVQRREPATWGDLEDRSSKAVAPPRLVVPYRFPLVAWTSIAHGFAPSPLWEPKLYSVVRVPLGVILNSVPQAADEDTVLGSAIVRCSVEVPIGGLDEPRVGVCAVAAL